MSSIRRVNLAALAATNRAVQPSALTGAAFTERPIASLPPSVSTRIPPGVFFPPGTFFPPPSTPGTPPPAPPPTQPPVPNLPSGAPVELQLLLASIPIAEDGHVITSDYHNSLRAALLAMANQLGAGLVTPTTTLTLTPLFFPDDPAHPWGFSGGVAQAKGTVVNSVGSVQASGYLPLQLPEGARLQNMTVLGYRSQEQENDTFFIALQRQPISDRTPQAVTTLANASTHSDGPFILTVPVQSATTGIDASTAQVITLDYQTVDNGKYKYFMYAKVDSGNMEVYIQAIQLTYQ